MGSSVQRGQTAVVVAVAVVVVVGQYFRVTFHGRRGRCSVPTTDDFVCRVAPFFFRSFAFFCSSPSRFRRIICNCWEVPPSNSNGIAQLLWGDSWRWALSVAVPCLQISTENGPVARRQNSWLCLLLLLHVLLLPPTKIRFVTVSCFDSAIMKLLRARCWWLRVVETTMA